MKHIRKQVPVVTFSQHFLLSLSSSRRAASRTPLSVRLKASSLAVDVKGRAPIFSKVLKSATAVRCAAANLLSGSTTNHHKTRLGKHSGGKNGSSSSIRRTTVIVDQDAAVQEIAWHHRGKRYSKPSMMISSSTLLEQQTSGSTKEGDHRLAHFSFIITRPTNFLKEGPSMKKVSASKSVCALKLTFKRLCIDAFLVEPSLPVEGF